MICNGVRSMGFISINMFGGGFAHLIFLQSHVLLNRTMLSRNLKNIKFKHI